MPAQDFRAEQSVLGALLHNPDLFTEIDYLKPEHFYSPANELIFKTLRQMYADGEKPDTIVLFGKLEESKELNRIGGPAYLSELLQSFKVAENITAYADLVVNKWKIRKCNEFGQRAMSVTENADEVDVILEQVHSFLDDVDSDQDSESSDLMGLYDEWLDWQSDDRPVIETPWLAVNDALNGGLVRQRMYVWGARPGNGKTVAVAEMGFYAALQHHSVLMFSMELSKKDLMSRIIAMAARVSYKELNSRSLSTATRGKVSQWITAAASLKFEVDDRADLTIEDIMQKCRIHKQRHGLDVVVIDYLQEVEESRGQSREQAISYIAKRARQIAKKLDCVVIVAAQLNRSIEDPKGKPRRPMKSDFRESGGIENVADVAVILTRPTDKDGNESKIPKMNCTFVKNRQGEERVVQLMERFDQQRFDNVFGSTSDDMRFQSEAVE